MPVEKYGIENIKKLLGFGIALGNAFGKAMEDKKFKILKEFHLFIPALMKTRGAIEAAPNFKDEYNDLSDQEKIELQEFVVKEFDIPQDKIEDQIQDSLALGNSIVQYVAKTRDRWKK